MRFLFPVFLLAILGACATVQTATLPGKVVDAEIVIPDGELVLVDWNAAGRIAAIDGVPYQPAVSTETQPSKAEIRRLQELEASNEEYARYLSRDGIIQRAQDLSIPELEAQLMLIVKTGIIGRSDEFPPQLFMQPGPPLKLVLTPQPSIIAPRASWQMTTGDAATTTAKIAIAGMLGSALTTRFISAYELTNQETGESVKSGQLNFLLKRPDVARVSGGYQINFARDVWANIAGLRAPQF